MSKRRRTSPSSSSSSAASSTLPPLPPISQLTEERFIPLRTSIQTLKNSILALKELEPSAAILLRKILIVPFLSSIKNDLGYSVQPIEEALDVLMTQYNSYLELAGKSERQILEEMQLPRIERERAGLTDLKAQREALLSERSTLEENLNSLRDSLSNYQTALESHRKKIESVKASKAARISELDELKTDVSSKKNQVSNLQEEINDAEQRLQSTNEQLGCLPENLSLCEDLKRKLLSSASASIVESLDHIMSLFP
eukprot:TRINITY_DN35308_c0_g1_i1.p1 TRINITY_DN35308_c0_g1~~TRINITY_DN35308_c0_g1_i1.p1  ORF type:complete len:256 (+),score=46.16 TRINITY_DN35308_c0_g1_i1:147-914(+)